MAISPNPSNSLDNIDILLLSLSEPCKSGKRKGISIDEAVLSEGLNRKIVTYNLGLNAIESECHAQNIFFSSHPFGFTDCVSGWR